MLDLVGNDTLLVFLACLMSETLYFLFSKMALMAILKTYNVSGIKQARKTNKVSLPTKSSMTNQILFVVKF